MRRAFWLDGLPRLRWLRWPLGAVWRLGCVRRLGTHDRVARGGRVGLGSYASEPVGREALGCGRGWRSVGRSFGRSD